MGSSSGVQQSGLATGFDRILRCLGGYEISGLCFTMTGGQLVLLWLLMLDNLVTTFSSHELPPQNM